MSDNNNGGFTSSGKNASMPNFVPTSIADGAVGDVSTRKIQTLRALYIITQTDVNNWNGGNGVYYFYVPVVWPQPFLDTNYTICFSIHDLDLVENGYDYLPIDLHNKTTTGCLAGVYMDSPVVGDQIELNFITIHD